LATDTIADKTREPDMQDIEKYIEKDAKTRWQSLISHIESTFGSKPVITYSVCIGKQGWNVKYKKSGKALCTLYPERDQFIALVVLSANDMQLFDIVKQSYTPYLTALYDRCKLFNGTKWLMITVSDDAILADVQKLMLLKLHAAGKNK